MRHTSVLGRARCRVREESAQEADRLSPSTARLARVIAEEVVRVHRGGKGDNSALPSGKQPQPIAATGSREPRGMSPSGMRRPRRRGAATISIVNPERGGGDRHVRRQGARSYLHNADPVLARNLFTATFAQAKTPRAAVRPSPRALAMNR